ncbi:MAG: DNA-directed RNA polymerase subunit omega [Desulfobacteraceae bacterium]|nr:MAG: DNA-directed RNA polymerase subunit omega [Desulfobacteraceae bacterium]
MARITIEDCLNKVNNRFTLIHMAAKRVRLLRKGSEPTISSKNKDIVVALREIAGGRVVKSDRTEPRAVEAGEQSALIPETTGEETPKLEATAGTDEEKKEPEEGGPTE